LIHYHGTPITPDADAARILAGRHALVSFARPDQIGIVSDVCQSFALDNGAYSAWKRGHQPDWAAYYTWVAEWSTHPGFDFALIPDVIDGDEGANDELLADWPFADIASVPVWHLHESLDRLDRLDRSWNRVALGSSGAYSSPGTDLWWDRMRDVMEVVCYDNGRPRVKLHGLRMMDPGIFSRLPLSSADSTSVARNIGLDSRWRGTYTPASKAARGIVLAERIERHQSAAAWANTAQQIAFALR
jgi:hypothetical protein